MRRRLILDENIPEEAVAVLEDSEWDILWIGKDHASISDEQVLELATSTGRLLVTSDRDFGELIFLHEMRPPDGVLYLRTGLANPLRLVDAITITLLSPNLTFAWTMTVYDGETYRQRKY